MPKVVFCTPIVQSPHPKWVESLEACLPEVEAAGWEHGLSQVVNNPYISSARALMLRKALDAGADVIVFLDYDVAWRPADMVKLLSVEGHVVAGLYRFKEPEERYMGVIKGDLLGYPIGRSDGCIKAELVPAGFLKVTREAVQHFMREYPELCYGDPITPHVDLFNHGARDGLWWGEDYSFSDRWVKSGGDIWVVPDMNIDHYSRETCYSGNLHQYLLRVTGRSPENEGQES